MMRRLAVVGLLIVSLPVTLAMSACGVNWFPKCDEPGNKCPPVPPGQDPVPYPPGAPFAKGADGGRDAR